MTTQFSEWYPPEVPPARPGWYQRKYDSFGPKRPAADPDYFDGERWFVAVGGRIRRVARSPLPWRGLAHNPNPVRTVEALIEKHGLSFVGVCLRRDGSHWVQASILGGRSRFAERATLADAVKVLDGLLGEARDAQS